jgi:hypothetical protein
MNAIGIDHGRTLTIISLREGAGGVGSMSPVGDGRRRLIPNAIAGDDRWGSTAFDAAAQDRRCGDEAGPWCDEAAARFWQHVCRRLGAYLGRTAPTPVNGYRTVISLTGADFRNVAGTIESLVRNAGLAEAVCIPAADALLCRWLAAGGPVEEGAERTVVLVAAGDRSVEVAARRVRLYRGEWHITAAGESFSIEETGQAAWLRRLSDEVHARLKEPLPPGQELALRDAALEFVMKFRYAEPARAVEWEGVFRERLFAPLRLTSDECRGWPEVIRLEAELPATVRQALHQVGAAAPDLIVVGGVGAAWPFPTDVAGRIARVWRSEEPTEDLACGAAWWPELGSGANRARLADATALPLSSLASKEPVLGDSVEVPDGTNTDEVPPWQLREWPAESDDV